MSTNSYVPQTGNGRIDVGALTARLSRGEMITTHAVSPPELGPSYSNADMDMDRSHDEEDGNSTVDQSALNYMKSSPQWIPDRDWSSQATPTRELSYQQSAVAWHDSPGSSIASSPKQGGRMPGKGKGKKMRQDDDGGGAADDEVDFEQAMVIDVQRIPVKTLRKVIPKLRIMCYMMNEASHGKKKLMDVQRIPVKTLRKVIPKLRIMCYMMNEASHGKKKFKHLWDERPPNWPAHIPFKDPNNAAKEVKKPGKEELRPMFEFLRTLYKNQQSQAQPSDEGDVSSDMIGGSLGSRYTMLPSGSDKPLHLAPAPQHPAQLHFNARDLVDKPPLLQQLIQQRQQQQQRQLLEERQMKIQANSGDAYRNVHGQVKQEVRYQRPEHGYQQGYTGREMQASPNEEEYNGRGGYDRNGGVMLNEASSPPEGDYGRTEAEMEHEKLMGYELQGRGLRGSQEPPLETRIPQAVQDLRQRLREKEYQVIDLSGQEETRRKVHKMIEDVNMKVIDRLYQESTHVPLSRLMFLDAGHQMEALLDVMSVLNRFDEELFLNGCNEILRKFSAPSMTVAPVTIKYEDIKDKLHTYSYLFNPTDLLNLHKLLSDPTGLLYPPQKTALSLGLLDSFDVKLSHILPPVDEKEFKQERLFSDTGLENRVELYNKQIKEGEGRLMERGYVKPLEAEREGVKNRDVQGDGLEMPGIRQRRDLKDVKANEVLEDRVMLRSSDISTGGDSTKDEDLLKDLMNPEMQELLSGLINNGCLDEAMQLNPLVNETNPDQSALSTDVYSPAPSSFSVQSHSSSTGIDLNAASTLTSEVNISDDILLQPDSSPSDCGMEEENQNTRGKFLSAPAPACKRIKTSDETLVYRASQSDSAFHSASPDGSQSQASTHLSSATSLDNDCMIVDDGTEDLDDVMDILNKDGFTVPEGRMTPELSRLQLMQEQKLGQHLSSSSSFTAIKQLPCQAQQLRQQTDNMGQLSLDSVRNNPTGPSMGVLGMTGSVSARLGSVSGNHVSAMSGPFGQNESVSNLWRNNLAQRQQPVQNLAQCQPNSFQQQNMSFLQQLSAVGQAKQGESMLPNQITQQQWAGLQHPSNQQLVGLQQPNQQFVTLQQPAGLQHDKMTTQPLYINTAPTSYGFPDGFNGTPMPHQVAADDASSHLLISDACSSSPSPQQLQQLIQQHQSLPHGSDFGHEPNLDPSSAISYRNASTQPFGNMPITSHQLPVRNFDTQTLVPSLWGPRNEEELMRYQNMAGGLQAGAFQNQMRGFGDGMGQGNHGLGLGDVGGSFYQQGVQNGGQMAGTDFGGMELQEGEANIPTTVLELSAHSEEAHGSTGKSRSGRRPSGHTASGRVAKKGLKDGGGGKK